MRSVGCPPLRGVAQFGAHEGSVGVVRIAAEEAGGEEDGREEEDDRGEDRASLGEDSR